MNKIEFTQFITKYKRQYTRKVNPKKTVQNTCEFKSKKTRKNLIIYAFLTLFCIAFLLLLSASTSPLYKDLCDGDSSIFIFFGKAITLGKDAYRDYFDHKGPILFYINALGYFLTKSKVGVFILQCISLSISSIFMYKTARFFTKPIRSVICVIITILAFGATISDGNLTEEYCILYCMIAIYTALKFITKHPKAPHPHKNMVIYGICFGICAFIRVNNGLIICGIVFVTIMTDFINEHIKEIFKNILYFIVGVLIVAVPYAFSSLLKGRCRICCFLLSYSTFYTRRKAHQKRHHQPYYCFCDGCTCLDDDIHIVIFRKTTWSKGCVIYHNNIHIRTDTYITRFQLHALLHNAYTFNTDLLCCILLYYIK